MPDVAGAELRAPADRGPASLASRPLSASVGQTGVDDNDDKGALQTLTNEATHRQGAFRICAVVTAVMAGLLLVGPLAGQAQQPATVYRLGILSPGGLPEPSLPTSPNLVPIALRELGYTDGQNLLIERRFAEGRIDRLPVLARELVQLRVDVIVAVSEAIPAAKDATSTIPIVMGFGFNPVEQGFISSLAALEEVERIRATLAELEKAVPVLSEDEHAAVLALGDDFAAVWESTACPPELKKKILHGARGDHRDA